MNPEDDQVRPPINSSFPSYNFRLVCGYTKCSIVEKIHMIEVAPHNDRRVFAHKVLKLWQMIVLPNIKL